MGKADPCARSGVILFGSYNLRQILGTNGLVVIVVVRAWLIDKFKFPLVKYINKVLPKHGGKKKR